jgi:hypothetical protein
MIDYGKHGIHLERARKLSGYGSEAERSDDGIVRVRMTKATKTGKRKNT